MPSGRILVLAASVSPCSQGTFCLHLFARLQDEEINKCKELEKAPQLGWERRGALTPPTRTPAGNHVTAPLALWAVVPLTDLTNRAPISAVAPRRSGRSWIGHAWRAACSAPEALWLVAAAAGAGRVRRRGGAAGARGRAGGRTAAGARARAGAAAAAEHWRRRSTMKQPAEPG